jgi:hypothetical protein
MNLVKARVVECREAAYGEVVLPGKKSTFFLKHGGRQSEVIVPNRILSCTAGGDRWGYIRPKGGQSY